MTAPAFQHRMAAHCESGTVAAQLSRAGLAVSEPMAFGIAGAIFFGYFNSPFFTFPVIALRNKPGCILKKTGKRLGVQFEVQRFRRPEKAMAALDEALLARALVGVQVDFFYMNYIPEYGRVHFNAHYVNVVGKEEGRYILSDCYAPTLVALEEEILRQARFARGKFAPRGMMFRVLRAPEKPDLARAVRAGIRDAVFYMRRLPLPYTGIRGIRLFARKVVDWPKLTRDEERLSHEIMMIHVALEERGTGGGGFRFLYATFLREAAGILGNPELDRIAAAMMENGDRWRDISLFVARIGKQRDLGPGRLNELSRMILERADAEDGLFARLSAAVG